MNPVFHYECSAVAALSSVGAFSIRHVIVSVDVESSRGAAFLCLEDAAGRHGMSFLRRGEVPPRCGANPARWNARPAEQGMNPGPCGAVFPARGDDPVGQKVVPMPCGDVPMRREIVPLARNSFPVAHGESSFTLETAFSGKTAGSAPRRPVRGPQQAGRLPYKACRSDSRTRFYPHETALLGRHQSLHRPALHVG